MVRTPIMTFDLTILAFLSIELRLVDIFPRVFNMIFMSFSIMFKFVFNIVTNLSLFNYYYYYGHNCPFLKVV